MLGTKLSDRYEIVAELGRGGMGVSAAADDGNAWGDWIGLSSVLTTHIFDFDTDYGLFAGVDAYRGHVVATWNDLFLSGTADPIAVSYQQNADSSP